MEFYGTRRFRHAFEDEDEYEAKVDKALRLVMEDAERKGGPDGLKQARMRIKRDEMDDDRFGDLECSGKALVPRAALSNAPTCRHGDTHSQSPCINREALPETTSHVLLPRLLQLHPRSHSLSHGQMIGRICRRSRRATCWP
jgi:hypothetical protein